MKIPINQIHNAINPIRTQQDEEKMHELVQSIKEQGLIVPIKVRPNNDGYEIVYGHRRLEACKRNNWTEIEANVEGVDDKDQLIQALIENVVREDMSPVETAKALKRLIEKTGWNALEIERKGIMSNGHTSRLLSLLSEDKDIQELVSHGRSDSSQGRMQLTERLIREVRGAELSPEEHKPVLIKAASEQLTHSQARMVAEAIKQAETPEEKKAILETPVTNPLFDRMVKAKARAEVERKAETAEKHMGNTQEVRRFLSAIKMFENEIKEAIEAIDYQKFSPEAMQFTNHRLEKLIQTIEDLKERLG